MGIQTIILLILQMLLALLMGCERERPKPAEETHTEAAAGATNRVDVPESVRRNLGITFAKVELRPVEQTIRVPGHFELQPDARREYRTMLEGRVEVRARQFERVEPGTVLYRLISPGWRELQGKLTEAESVIRQTEARVGSIPTLIAAHRRHEEVLERSIDAWEVRLGELTQSRQSGAVSEQEFITVQATLLEQRAELAEILEKEADLEGQIIAAQAEHDAAHIRFRMLLATAAELMGVEVGALCAPNALDEHFNVGIHTHSQPASRPASAWQQIDAIEVRADAPGVVQSQALTNGAWATVGSLVLSTVEPEKLRFRAMG